MSSEWKWHDCPVHSPKTLDEKVIKLANEQVELEGKKRKASLFGA